MVEDTRKNLRMVANSIGTGADLKPSDFNGILAVITGSMAYGTPNKDSDLDMALLCSKEEMTLFQKMADLDTGMRGMKDQEYSNEEVSISLRFGRLNLLVTADEEYFDVWCEGVHMLKEEKPVTRERAVQVFDRLREKKGYYITQKKPIKFTN